MGNAKTMIMETCTDRRRFIKSFACATAYSSLLGKAWTQVLAAEVGLASTGTTGILRINLGNFPALLSESGSVRLAINPLRRDLLPDGQFYPVIINRGPNNVFYALNSRCTHESCTVDPMDAASNRMTCPCHGSVFGIDGRRLVGPALTALSRYTLTFDGQETLAIQIPGLGYSVTGSSVQTIGTGTPRFRLDFRALRNVSYEILFRESLDREPAPVPFSSRANGAADQTAFTAVSNATASLFVERTSEAGFYTVAVRLTEI